MDVTTALTGMLPFIVVVSAVLTALVAVLLLWLYKRAFLENQLQVLWGQVPSDSPNRGHQPPVVRLFVAPSSVSRAADSLVKRLLER